MRLDIRAFSVASAAAGMLLYSFGALIDRLGVWGAAGIVSYIFRVEVIQLAQPFSWGALVLGILVIGILFGLLGGIMAWFYNVLARRAAAAAVLATLMLMVVSGCYREDEGPPRSSLRDLAASGSIPTTPPELSQRARDALAKGNEAYRAGRFAAALESYRVAARESSRSAAPYFGILMAAQKLGDAALADSASAMLARLGEAAPGAGAHGGIK